MKKKCKNIDEKTGKVCGFMNRSDAEYCAECGAKLNTNTKPGIWLVVLIALLFVGVCVTICLRIYNKPDSIRVEIRAKSAVDSVGTVLGGGVYVKDTIIKLITLPREGFRFVQWNDGNTDSVRTIVADSDKEYIAIFEACNRPVSDPEEVTPVEDSIPPVTIPKVPQFKISVVPSNPDGGRVTGDDIYDSLASATIEAIAYEGYQFVSWDDGNKNAKRTIKVTANQRFVATFKEKPSVPTSPTPEPSEIKVDWNGVATYTGPGLGSQPDGFGGKLVFYKDYQLDLKKIDGRKLDIKAGEIIEPTKFKDGKLNIIGVGTLHRKDGTTHPIM